MPDDPNVNAARTDIQRLAESVGKLDARVQHTPNQSGEHGTLADPGRDFSNFLHDAARNKGSIKHGTIVEAIPHLQQYRVLIGGKSVRWYTRARIIGGTDFGLRDNSSLAVGTCVEVTQCPFTKQDIIIGVIPDPGGGNYSDFITPGTTAAVLKSGFKQFIEKAAQFVGSGFRNGAGGSPMDSLTDGAFNLSATTGMMFHVDRYMAQLRIDEMTGLFLYYWDRYVRLCGYNFARWTANSILENYDDEGEHYSYEGWTAYPWEQRGILWDPADAATAIKTLEEQREAAGYTRINPDEWDYQPFHRLAEYKGYLGQGKKTFLSVPPQDKQYLRYSEDTQIPGVFEETLTLSGHYGVRTATGLTIAKRPIIPIPKRKKLPEDPEGDSKLNAYSPSGYGDDDHKVETTLSAQGSDPLSLVSSAGVLDLHAYLFNWESAHPFRLHSQDFDLPHESEAEVIYTNQEDLTISDLQSGGPMAAPEPYELKLDHRQDAFKVYPNTAYITLADDGNLVIGDGYGSEIRMGGGSIRMTAPGDVTMEGGRNVMSFAGKDVILKARQNIEGTTSEKDIYFKSEQNIKLLAANNEGPHHILLECRGKDGHSHYGASGSAPESYDDNILGSGIIFNTQDSEIVGLAANVYFRATTSDAITGGTMPNGVIALDAPSDYGVVRTNSKYFINTVDCGVLHFFNSDPTGGNFFSSKYTTITSSCSYFNGNVFAHGNVVAKEDLYGSSIAVANQDLLVVTDTQLAAAIEPHRDWHEASGTLVLWHSEDLTDNWQTGWGTAGATSSKDRPGYPEAIPEYAFAFRDADKCCASEFTMVESRWMRMARNSGASGTTVWQEKPVKDYEDEDTWPYPGKSYESSGDKWYYIYDSVLYNDATGVSKNSTDAAYDAANFGELDERVFNETYLAIADCSV